MIKASKSTIPCLIIPIIMPLIIVMNLISYFYGHGNWFTLVCCLFPVATLVYCFWTWRVIEFVAFGYMYRGSQIRAMYPRRTHLGTTPNGKTLSLTLGIYPPDKIEWLDANLIPYASHNRTKGQQALYTLTWPDDDPF